MEKITDGLQTRDKKALAAVVPATDRYVRRMQSEDRALQVALQKATCWPAIQAALVDHCDATRRLQALDLHGSNLQAEGALAVGQTLSALCPEIERLNLSNCSITHMQAAHWQLPALKILNLSNNPQLLEDDAPTWQLPASLEGINLQGTPLPLGWDSGDMFPVNLKVLNIGDWDRAQGWVLPPDVRHLTATHIDGLQVAEDIAGRWPQLSAVTVIEGNSVEEWRSHAGISQETFDDAEGQRLLTREERLDERMDAIRRYTSGVRLPRARRVITSVAGQATAHALALAGTMYMEQRLSLRLANTPLAVPAALTLWPAQWGYLPALTLLSGVERVATFAQAQDYAALGDIAARASGGRAAAAEAIFLAGDSLWRGATAPPMLTSLSFMAIATASPVLVSGAGSACLGAVAVGSLGASGGAQALAGVVLGIAGCVASVKAISRYWPAQAHRQLSIFQYPERLQAGLHQPMQRLLRRALQPLARM